MAGASITDLIWRERGAHWSPELRLLSAYLLSGPAANRIGCFELFLEKVALDTNLQAERVSVLLGVLETDGFVQLDSGWIWVPEILARNPFMDSDEVRGALPELASVPRHAAFHADLVRAFRASADRPGTGGPLPPTALQMAWLAGIVGDRRAADLALRLTTMEARIHRVLPGLPPLSVGRIHAITELWIKIIDYLRRCRGFFADLVSTRPLRRLGLAAIVGAVLFIVFPGIDLGVARWFFEPPRDFTLGATWVGRFFDTDVHYGMEWFLALLVGAFIVGEFRGRPLLGMTRKRFLFVALSIALGAGLLTNTILKDSWGRARPSQIVQFGGTKQFTPPFMRSDQCTKNCSFVSGDASLAASFLAFAVVAERHRRRWWTGLSLFTALVGVMRMARGSHFLSDVVFAVIFTLMVVLVLARLILDDRWRAWPRWREPPIPPEQAAEPAGQA